MASDLSFPESRIKSRRRWQPDCSTVRMAKRRDPKANRPVAPPPSREEEDDAPTETPDDQPTFGSEGGGGSYHGGPNAEGPEPDEKDLPRPDPALS